MTITLTVLSILIGIANLVLIILLVKYIKSLRQSGGPKEESQPKPKKFVVPGRGIFFEQPQKRSPKYFSDEELWQKEQDERNK